MGSDAGGQHAAAVYSLVETAKLNGLDPEGYLREVLGRIADHPIKRIDYCRGTSAAAVRHHHPTVPAPRLPETAPNAG